MDWIAKTRPRESLTEHTTRLLVELERLKKASPSILDETWWQLLRIAAATHDLGKTNTRFQNRLREALGLTDRLPSDGLNMAYQDAGVDQVPHGFLSPAYIDLKALQSQFDREEIALLILAVFRHHLRDRVPHELIAKVVSADLPHDVTKLPFLEGLPVGSPTNTYLGLKERLWSIGRLSDESWRNWVMLKGLLNRLDYAASARNEVVSVPEPGHRLTDRLHSFFANLTMRPVQKYMYQHLGHESAVVIASTGVGKTEAALLWIGNQQGFYTLPVRTAINAMYRRILSESDGALGFKHVSVLHSDALQVLFQDHQHEGCEATEVMEEAYRSLQQTRLLSKPLTICTVDQLFRFVFRYEGCEALLSTLAGSAVVLDEIQMYSPPVLACILSGLKTITDLGGRFAIVTATFPPILGQLMHDMGIPFVSPERPFLCDLSVRHRIAFIDSSDFDIKEIARESHKRKVLVIVNTVKRAQEVATRLKEQGSRVKLLHSRFMKCHRDQLESDIIRFAGKGAQRRNEPGVWVTTQVVEASLDVDFDVLFTEMSTLEGLFQRMGRVWRHRRSEYSGPPNVFILANRNGVPRVIDPDLYQMGLDLILKYDGQELSEENKMDMVHRLYDPIYNTQLRSTRYYRDIASRLSSLSIEPGRLTASDAIKQFRDIASISVVPESVYCDFEMSGQATQWGRLIADTKADRYERLLARSEMMLRSVSVPDTSRWRAATDREEAYFRGSGLYRCRLEYSWFQEGGLSLGLTNEQFEDDSLVEG